MNNNKFEINYKKRHNLSKSEKIYNYASSFLLISIGVFGIIKGFFNTAFLITFIFLGLIPLILNLWGKQTYLTRHSIKTNDNWITIITLNHNKVTIPLKSVEQISILTNGLKFSFCDSVKFIDLSWMDSDQFQLLKDNLLSLSKLHDFKIH